MKNIVKTKKGFTLVELVIVIVIVGILSVVSVPIYRGYVEKAKITEGKVLVNALVKTELAYLVQHGEFYDDYGEYSEVLDIDARGNKYFRYFDCYVSGGGGVDKVSAKKTTLNYLLKKEPADIGYYGQVFIQAVYNSPTGQYVVSTTLYADGTKTEMEISNDSYGGPDMFDNPQQYDCV